MTHGKNLTANRYRVARWAAVLGGVVAGCALLALLLPEDSRLVAFVILSVPGLVGAFLLGLVYLDARRTDRQITAAQRDAVIRWSYTPAEWEAWVALQSEWLVVKPRGFVFSRDWKRLIVPLVLGYGGIWYASEFYRVLPGVFLVIFSMLFFATPVLQWRRAVNARDNYRRKLISLPREACISCAGYLFEGVFTPWNVGLDHLLSAGVEEFPIRHLRLIVQRYVMTNRRYEKARVQVEQRVLLPASGAELGPLAELMRTARPEAKIDFK